MTSRYLALLPAALIAAVGLSGCAGAPAATTSANTPAYCADGPISFGIEPYEDPAKLEPAYRVLADAMEERLGCEVEVQVVEDYSAEVLAMANNRLDIGQFGPMGYVFASSKAGAEPVATFGTADGQLSSYTAGIWVAKDSDIRSIEDLRGKDVALGGVGSTSGDVLPRYGLKKAGVAESELNISYAGGHPEALLALTNGTVDAAQINSQTLTSATAAGTFKPEDFRQVWTSDAIPNDPITIRGSADPALKEAVTDALMNLPAESIAEVGAFLDVTPPGPLLPVTRETYQPLFDLAETMGLTEEDL